MNSVKKENLIKKLNDINNKYYDEFNVLKIYSLPGSIYKIMHGGSNSDSYKSLVKKEQKTLKKFNNEFFDFCKNIDNVKYIEEDILNFISNFIGLIEVKNFETLSSKGLDFSVSLSKNSLSSSSAENLLDNSIFSKAILAPETLNYLLVYYNKNDISLERQGYQHLGDFNLLHQVCCDDEFEKVKAVLENGFAKEIYFESVFKSFNGLNNVLTWAISTCSVNVVKLLVQYGANLNTANELKDNKILACAFQNRNGKLYSQGIFDYLLSKGFSLKNQDFNVTELVLEENNIDMLMKLIEQDVNPLSELNCSVEEIKCRFKKFFSEDNKEKSFVREAYEIVPYQKYLSLNDIKKTFYIYLEKKSLENKFSNKIDNTSKIL